MKKLLLSAIASIVCGVAIAQPTTDPISGPGSVCVGSAITLADDVSGGTWSSSDSTVAAVDLSGDVTGINAGVATISYTLGTSTVVSVITVNPIPAPITGVFSICTGATSTLTDATAGGSWAVDNTSIATIGALSGMVTGVAPGAATVSYINSSGCSTSQTITVSVAPDAGTISGASSVCVDATITMTTTGANGVWSSGNTAYATIDPVTGIVTGVGAGNVAIYYTSTTACSTASTSVGIAVNPLPSVPAGIGGASLVCVNSHTTLTNAVAGGNWTSSDATVATIVAASGVVKGIAAGDVTLTYTISNVCGANSTEQAMTVYPLPVAGTITGVSPMSIGDVLTVNDTASGGTWKSCNSAIASVSSTGVLSGLSDGITVITYSVPSAHCGTARAYASVTVGDCSIASDILTFAGNHTSGYSGDGSSAVGAQLGS